MRPHSLSPQIFNSENEERQISALSLVSCIWIMLVCSLGFFRRVCKGVEWSTLRYILASCFIIVCLSHSQVRQGDQQFIKCTLFDGKLRHQPCFIVLIKSDIFPNISFSPAGYYFNGTGKGHWTQSLMSGPQIGYSLARAWHLCVNFILNFLTHKVKVYFSFPSNSSIL